jgi:hypothetical protein
VLKSARRPFFSCLQVARPVEAALLAAAAVSEDALGAEGQFPLAQVGAKHVKVFYSGQDEALGKAYQAAEVWATSGADGKKALGLRGHVGEREPAPREGQEFEQVDMVHLRHGMYMRTNGQQTTNNNNNNTPLHTACHSLESTMHRTVLFIHLRFVSVIRQKHDHLFATTGSAGQTRGQTANPLSQGGGALRFSGPYGYVADERVGAALSDAIGAAAPEKSALARTPSGTLALLSSAEGAPEEDGPDWYSDSALEPEPEPVPEPLTEPEPELVPEPPPL